MSDIESLDVTTFMVSLDPPDKNRAFAESVGAGFTLLSDPGGRAARAYGVLGPGGGYAQRVTFVVDREGVIRDIDRNVSPSSHGSDITRMLRKLGFGSEPNE